MADRVKYFLLGVLFLVVAGVIAYDRWNSAGEPRQDVAARPEADTGADVNMSVVPTTRETLTVERDNPLPNRQPVATDPAVPVGPPVPQQPLPSAPAPVVERTPKPEAPVPDKTHVIRKGETLEAIAIKYYGTREGIEWIVDANRLGNANRIFANQKLVIPAKKETATEGEALGRPMNQGRQGEGGTARTKSPGAIPSRYKVKAGDGNLYAICRKFYGREGQGARVARVMELNHLYSADVKAGTTLLLPPR